MKLFMAQYKNENENETKTKNKGGNEMTTRFKKISLWYSIFILTLVLNQSNAARKDNVVITVIYGLWILLVVITWIYFKEGDWE